MSIKTWVISGVALVVLVIGFFSCTVSIDQGTVGVVYSRSSGIQDETLGQGLRWVSPMERVTAYPVSTQSIDAGTMKLATKDGKPLKSEVSYSYYIEADKAPAIYNKFKGSKPEVIETGWLKSRLTDAIVSVTGKYSILGVYQDTETIKQAIQVKFQDSVKEYGFVIETVTIGTPTADAQTEKALQDTINAQQKVEKALIEKKRTTIEAETKVEKAKGEANAAKIKAEGEAEANRMLSKSLTDEIVEYKQLEKWDGKLPTVTGGATPFVNVK